jgi:hypothetical protein
VRLIIAGIQWSYQFCSMGGAQAIDSVAESRDQSLPIDKADARD